MGLSTFGIFPDKAGRKAHLAGQVAAALGTHADLWASPLAIEMLAYK